MPTFDNETGNMGDFTASGIRFSGVRPDQLRIGQCTVVGMMRDRSSSVKTFEQIIEKTSIDAIKGCRKCPQPDTLLIRFVDFGSTLIERHGFKQLSMIDPDKDYALKCGGSTLLLDGMFDMFSSVDKYGSDVYDKDIDTNAIIFIFTDGEDVGSKRRLDEVKDRLDALRANEKIESVLVLLVGVNTKSGACAGYLQNIKDTLGLDAFINIEVFTENDGPKLANWVTSSVSSQSSSLGTGGPSQVLKI